MRRQPIAYSIAAIFLTLAVSIPSGLWYTNHVQKESDQRWCELLVTMDDAYQAGSPTTEIGRKIAALMHKLRVDFGC